MKQTDIKQRLYIIVLKSIMLFSVLAIIVNIIGDFPLSSNIKWIFLFSLFLTGIFMPLGFIDAGGSKSDTMAYIFFALIVTTYLLEGLYRQAIIATPSSLPLWGCILMNIFFLKGYPSMMWTAGFLTA